MKLILFVTLLSAMFLVEINDLNEETILTEGCLPEKCGAENSGESVGDPEYNGQDSKENDIEEVDDSDYMAEMLEEYEHADEDGGDAEAHEIPDFIRAAESYPVE
ncbi:hypothetical protein AAG570_006573 [Ranatra chinensis]|uniref:Uncharacterized protein n=1 Tax=Ranatra chinensis TaxID=642074 RepID=A0ABD0YUG0_9HEMI